MYPNDQVNRDSEDRSLSRRDFLRIGAVGAASCLLAGCARQETPQATQAPVPTTKPTQVLAPTVVKREPQTIRLVSWYWNESGRNDAWRAMVEKYHASQNDVRIEEAGWPFSDFSTQLLIQLAAGKIEGDIITTTPDLAPRLLKAGVLAPVEEVVKNLGITTLSKAHDFITKDGHLYGLDTNTVAYGLLYNSMLYEKHGITSAPTTVEEFLDVSKRLTRAPDLFGTFATHLMSEGGRFWFYLQEFAMPYDGVFAVGQKPTVTSDGIIKGLKFFKSLYDCCIPLGTDTPTAYRMIANSQIASMLVVSAAVGIVRKENPEVYPYLRSLTPPWPSKKSLVRIHPACLLESSEKKDAAKQFMQWLYKPENLGELQERALDVIPPYPESQRKEYRDSLHWIDGYANVVAVTNPDILGEFINYNDEFGTIVTTHFQETLSANKPVEDTMAAAQKELELLAARVFG